MEKEIYSDPSLYCSTHVELLQTRARDQPEQRAYTFLANGETEESYLTYAGLDQRARTIAALLQTQQTYGQPVLLLYQPGLEYIAAFFGCLYAGAIAIPAYPPRLNHSLERLETIVADAQPVIILSSQILLTTVIRGQITTSPQLGKLPIVTTDVLSNDLARNWQKPALSEETLAFLQYSSGSTGKPKGVMVSHRNLFYNHRMLQGAFHHPASSPFVSWLPLFHDMGLIGKVLQSIYCGAPCILMSPLAFLQKPLRWLQAISHYQAYSSYAPNFAYDLCVQQITPEQCTMLDLSYWRIAGNAAEPIRHETLERFVRTFAPYGFRHEALFPSYGLAEATLLVTTRNLDEQIITQERQQHPFKQQQSTPGTDGEPHIRKLVSCGHTLLDQKILIVDPETRKECLPAQEGEIWLSGPHIAQGYWKQPQQTAETFQARLADTAEGPFLRTGDLGFLRQGELFVTGRLKDLIIAYGRNFYPQDIELAAQQSHPALRTNSNAAFSLDLAGEERVILVQEIERQYRHQEPQGIFATIRQAVFEQHELHLHGIVLIKPGSIPKTTSGKIQRRACREALLDHHLPILFTDVPANIEELIRPEPVLQIQPTELEAQTVVLSGNETTQVRQRSNASGPEQRLLAHRNAADTRKEEPGHMQFSLLYFASDESSLSAHKYELLLEGARFADKHDFTAIWVPERHFHPFGGLYPNPSVLAAALAVVTDRIRLRAGSVVLPMHHPARVAEEWSVVDNLSSGRVDIAFATGWNPNDFALAPENYAQRKEILFAGIETFNRLWSGDSINWPNGVGKETSIKIYPQPVQSELTPWITCTGNPERFIEAGAMGANILTGLLFQSVDELAEKIRLYRDARARHGHEPEQGHVTLMLHTFIDEDLEEVRRKVRQPFTAYLESSVDLWRHGSEKLDNLTPQERESMLSYAFERYFHTHALFGTPQTCDKMVNHLSEIGVDEIASLIDFGLDVDTVMDGLHWLNVLRKRWLKRALPEHTRASELQHHAPASKAFGQKNQSLSASALLSSSQQDATLLEYLRQQIAHAVERRPEELAGNIDLRSLGLDSLKVMNIVNNCQRDLSIMVDAGQFYELTSLESLATYIAGEYSRVHADGRVRQSDQDRSPALERLKPQMNYPQSFAQQRMWFLNQLQPDSIAYNVLVAIKIKGYLDVEALRKSFEEIVRRHEILRTTFGLHQGQPVQIIGIPAAFSLPVVDLRTTLPQERQAAVQQRALQEVQRPFDLTTGPLLRATLLQLDPASSTLILTYHHIVADGWSRGILMNELKTLYSAFVSGQPSPLIDLPLQYTDFAVWQRVWFRSSATFAAPTHPQEAEEPEQTLLARQLHYWKKQLAGPLPVLDLPTDHPRPPIQRFQGAHQEIDIPASLMQALRTLSQREGVTLFMTLLASFQLLLARYSGQNDILVGSPIAGRTRTETEPLIGSFANTLVLRGDLSGNPTFQEMLRRIRRVCLEAYAHQEAPFEQVVETVDPTRDLSRSPLFQVMFGLHDASWWQEGEIAGINLQMVEMESQIAVFDITWSVTTEGFGMVEYNTDLFEADTITRMLGHWYELLRNIITNPGQRLAEIPLLTEKEQTEILIYWNETQQPPSQTLCLHQIFEQQVCLTPTAIAIKTSTTSLTYQEVERRANRLALALYCLGLTPGGHVGVCMNKSPETFIGLLAILKAGGVYVPLDPHYPQERLAFMVEDAQISLLLTQQKVRHRLPELAELPALHLEPGWFSENNASTDPLPQKITPHQLAYIIYTSGSTGRPKGVQVSHQGIQNMIATQKRHFALKPGDHILQFSSLSFDASIWEICMSLCTGATLCLGEEEAVLAGPVLESTLIDLAITVVTLPPSLLASLSPTALPQLHTIIVAGEACPAELVANWAEGRRFFNAYGPTEATVCATLERCTDNGDKPSIGCPVDQAQMYILDPSLHPVPVGIPGELCIGGSGLAYGYLNRPALTAERFIPHPFSRQQGMRLYRTGDRGRYKADGTIEFLGRIDEQVKIHGHRIEPGEIEAAFLQHTAVQECAVVAKRNLADELMLVAYVVSRPGNTFSVEELRAHLQRQIPEYMLPALILPLEQMPLTPNGKIDRQSLPDPEEMRQMKETTLVLPSTATEHIIAAIWQDSLLLEKIGLHENFFELGGHSLLVVQVIQRTQEHFQREVALTDLFEYPTVSAFASYLDRTSQPAHFIHGTERTLPTSQEEALLSGKNRLKNRRKLQEKELVND